MTNDASMEMIQMAHMVDSGEILITDFNIVDRVRFTDKSFKVGDRVKFKYYFQMLFDKQGTIIRIKDDNHKFWPKALVEFDEYIGGHDGGGMGKDGHCWWSHFNLLELVQPIKIDESEMEKFL